MVPSRLPSMIALYLEVPMGFFHAARASPGWVFPHWLDSAQHPIPHGDGAYKFIIINHGPHNWSVTTIWKKECYKQFKPNSVAHSWPQF